VTETKLLIESGEEGWVSETGELTAVRKYGFFIRKRCVLMDSEAKRGSQNGYF